MTKLTDTQLVVLSAASQRDNRLVLPLPKKLKGGAAQKTINSLIAKGLIEEVDANRLNGDPVWRDSGDGRSLTLLLTDAGLAALDGDTAPRTARNEKRGRRKPALAKKSAAAARQPRQLATKSDRTKEAIPTTREGTKQARLIEMLGRPAGATIAEIAKSLEWQPHTVRGALAGALKKRLGLAISSKADGKRGRVYRIG